MLSLNIPGQREFRFEHLVLDFNGTIAFNGKVIDGVKGRLEEIEKLLTVHVITADTNGSAVSECSALPVKIKIIDKKDQLEIKGDFIRNLDSAKVIAIGNGVNDQTMLEESRLGIAVIGKEGCAVSTLIKSKIVVNDINDALDLILNKNRLTATLRR